MLNKLSNYIDQFIIDGINEIAKYKRMFNHIKNKNFKIF